MAAGAIVLSAVGFLASKANKMRAGVTTAYGVIAGSNFTISGLPSAHFTNVLITGKTAILATAGGKSKLATLFTNVGRTAKVYYH